ncbi:MAG TPA: DUF4350 domain-containing protein [Candidatus Cybelea sp.]|jgi:hypothetical protein|nr:DUF4350 domain-containing protein [Candidatus Cybelea sp.]
MIKLRLDVIAVVICGLVLVLLGYERSAMERRQHPSVYSTYDTGPNGYRALYEVLRTTGLPMQRFERVLGVLDPSIRTLVVTGYENDPSAKPLDEHDAETLHRFVLNGGRLVAIDAEFAGPQDIAPGVGTTLQTRGGTAAIALARNAFTEGVARVRGAIDWTFPFKEPRGVPLLANDRGMVAVWYRFGRGEVIAIAAPALFGNAQLRNADNLRFAYNAIAGHGGVAFDEYVHGYNESLSMWGALPAPVHAAVWIVVALVAIALIGANVPFAPPYLPEARDERDSSDYITALAELMRRSRRRPPDNFVIWQARVTLNLSPRAESRGEAQRRKEHA